MCSTMGQMSGVWRAVCVFSKYSGITTVYGYNPLVTWNVKDNTKALMLVANNLAKLPWKSRLEVTCLYPMKEEPKEVMCFFKIS